MLSLEQRLFGGDKYVAWSADDIEIICRHFGASSAGPSWRRDVSTSAGVPPLPLSVGKDDGKQISFTISPGAVDRMGDTVNPYGWRTAGYLQNPVVSSGATGIA